MVEAGGLPLWGCSEKFAYVSLSGFGELQQGGETGARDTPIDHYRRRPIGDGHVALYEYALRSGVSLYSLDLLCARSFRHPKVRPPHAPASQALSRGG